MDYTAIPPKVADYDFAAQMVSQIWGVCTTLVWSGIGSAILYKVVDVIVGLRVKRGGPNAKVSDVKRAHRARLQHVSSPGARSSRGSRPTTPVWAHTRQCPDR